MQVVHAAYFLRFMTDPALALSVRDSPHVLEDPGSRPRLSGAARRRRLRPESRGRAIRRSASAWNRRRRCGCRPGRSRTPPGPQRTVDTYVRLIREL